MDGTRCAILGSRVRVNLNGTVPIVICPLIREIATGCLWHGGPVPVRERFPRVAKQERN